MRAFLSILVLALAEPAAAHETSSGGTGWLAPTGHLEVTLPLAVAALAYACGLWRLWSRRGLGRAVRPWRAVLFAAGWLVLAIAIASPLHAIGARLFTAHMAEHELLMVIAAPLLVLARPLPVFLWALPQRRRAGLGLRLVSRLRAFASGSPALATAVHGVAIWAWHVPILFQAALDSVAVHWLQHVTFFVSAIWFWAVVLAPRSRGTAAAVAALFITMMHTGLLGVLLALAPRTIFPAQSAGAAEFGLTPLEDQQLAGLLMWVPTGLVYIGAGLALIGRWLWLASRRGGEFARS